jgi:F-type H+-transporting ATPase subunit a
VRGWNDLFGDPLLNPTASVGVTHVVFTFVLVGIIGVMAMIAWKRLKDPEKALVPDGRLTITSFMELICDAVLNMMTDLLGAKAARRYFPLIGALAVFIFIGNVMGLVVGLYPPTSNLNTSFACALVVFVVYNVGGFKEMGVGYIKHFFGPVALLAPLFLAIELVSHAFRPVSLSVRLAGNMTGDHIMLEIFGDIAADIINVPFLLPVPFLFMGLLVSIIQAVVFCMLSTIYIALAVHHDDH